MPVVDHLPDLGFLHGGGIVFEGGHGIGMAKSGLHHVDPCSPHEVLGGKGVAVMPSSA